MAHNIVSAPHWKTKTLIATLTYASSACAESTCGVARAMDQVAGGWGGATEPPRPPSSLRTRRHPPLGAMPCGGCPYCCCCIVPRSMLRWQALNLGWSELSNVLEFSGGAGLPKLIPAVAPRGGI